MPAIYNLQTEPVSGWKSGRWLVSFPHWQLKLLIAAYFKTLREFNTRLEVVQLTRPYFTRIISDIEKKNRDGNYLFAIMVDDRLEKLLKRLLDEAEFLSGYGIRSLSRIHKENPDVPIIVFIMSR